MIALSLFFFKTAHANCDDPMRLRKILPEGEASVDTRIMLSTVGNGTADHFELFVYDSEENLVETTTTSHCYVHESDTEWHCNLVAQPVSPLQPLQEYQVLAQATPLHQNPNKQIRGVFATTENTVTLANTAPTLTLLSYEQRTDNGGCDWENSFKHNFLVALQERPENAFLQVYEHFDTEPPLLVHTLFLNANQTQIDFRQVVHASQEGNHCYSARLEDIYGNQSDASEVICYDPYPEPQEDTASTDTGEEPEVPLSEPEAESPPTTEAEASKQGCSYVAPIRSLFFFPLLILARRRRVP